MTGKKKKILLVKPILPYPPDQGTKVVSFWLIRTLSLRYDVTVLARILNREDEAVADELRKHCSRVVTLFPSNRKSLLHRAAFKLWYTLVSRVRRRSLKSLYDCPGAFVNAARALAAEDFDLVVLEYWQLYPLLSVFPRDKTVLLTHDIDLLVNRQSSLLEKRLFQKIAKVRRWLQEQREEVYAYKNVNRVLALTPRDAKAVRTIAKTDLDVDVLPMGFDTGSFDAPGGRRGDKEVLFMGAMNAGFNQDALEHFVNKIYPHLDEEAGLTFTIVGGALPKSVAHFGSLPNVNVVGRVGDVRPYLGRAACIVIPLRFGGGLRIRIIEAMMAGLPVVCSSVAIAGMDFEPGSEFLLADEPKDAADAVKKLTQNREFAAQMAQAAKRAVVERYGEEIQAGKTLELFADILNH